MKKVYFNEYNILMNDTVFLPIVSGLLQVYSQKKQIIKDNYQFMPFLFIRDKPNKILKRYDNPFIAAFSCSMWNMNLNLFIAEQIKNKWPECLIIFGGHHVPREGVNFLKKYPYIDVTIRGEGEIIFSNILEAAIGAKSFKEISGISYRKDDTISYNEKECELIKDLDIIPSPYLEGVYDYLFDGAMRLQPIIETNRGCPYGCKYCSWSGENKKLRFFGMDRVKNTLDWCGQHKIEFVLCADANFGISNRDYDIAKYVVRVKEKYGYPHIFRMCYGKNSEENMFKIGKLLNNHGLTKAISMARQSNNQEVLRLIGRKNMDISFFDNLQKKYNDAGIPTSTDIILGLPGETYDSFKDGLEKIMQTDFKSQLLVYPLQIYPNTDLDKDEYRKRYEIKTVKLPLNEVHGSIRQSDDISEEEELVISTSTLPIEHWKRSMMILFISQLLHSLKLGFFISSYLYDRYKIEYIKFYEYIAQLPNDNIIGNEIKKYNDILEDILKEKPRGQILKEFSNTYWEVEEASYLTLSKIKTEFFNNLSEIVKSYIKNCTNIQNHSLSEIENIIMYQKLRVPSLYSDKDDADFNFNVPEYFDKLYTQNRCELVPMRQTMHIKTKNYNGDKEKFAREVILYGRKSEKMLNDITYENS